MSSITDAENKKNLIDTMGQSTGGLFYIVYNEVCFLRIKFAEFREIYGKDKETVDLLNSLCGDFFGKLQTIMKDDINIALSRLLDKTKNTGSLPHLIGSISDSKFKKDLRIQLDQINKLAKDVFDLRHSRLAHTNKHHRLHGKTKLQYSSRATIKDLIEKICSILNQIHIHYKQATLMFTILDENPSSRCLISKLKIALEYEQKQKI